MSWVGWYSYEAEGIFLYSEGCFLSRYSFFGLLEDCEPILCSLRWLRDNVAWRGNPIVFSMVLEDRRYLCADY